MTGLVLHLLVASVSILGFTAYVWFQVVHACTQPELCASNNLCCNVPSWKATAGTVQQQQNWDMVALST